MGHPIRVPWDILYFDAPNADDSVVAFLDGCPATVEAKLLAVLDAVAAAPPPQFSGGGLWEAMHGDMGGFYEVRVTGPGREQFRLFCILDNADTSELQKRGLPGPAIAVIMGMRKAFRSVFTELEYSKVRRFGAEYTSSYPRKILQ